MEVNILDVTDVEKEISIQVSSTELEPHFDKAYRKEQSKLTIKGFRKGKAPLDLVKKLYGESIEYESLSHIASDCYKQITEEKNIEPVGEPVLIDMNYKRGEELTFKIKYEIKPTFELKEYKGISVEKVVHHVTEKEIEEEIYRLRKANSTMVEVQEATDDEHVLTADVQELDDSGAPLIGRKTADMKLYLADEGLFPQIKETLRGATVSAARRTTIETEREGTKRKSNLEFTIKKIEKIQLPEFDDALVKKVTKEKMSTVAEFRERLKEDLESYWTDFSERNAADALIHEIVQRHDMSVPEALIKAISDSYLDDLKNQYPDKALPKDFDETKFREDYRSSAIFQAKWFLIRERITEVEGISINDEELAQRAESDAPKMGIEKERLLQFYRSSQTLKDKLVSEKLMAFLKAQTKYTEKIADEVSAEA